ncbi:adenine methyltransferase [Leptospira langatensis]|uniref:Adenine methyltransferase n=1 Tax=Leptospira langatensis TaxID=2484983 RepID=A0A5R2ASV0_9LEPT|nr:DNA N-6-adenine-methyltransferase [Leptospira langatensis]TGJ99817.1 adenine methyltransferase [Leptospira langatensis]
MSYSDKAPFQSGSDDWATPDSLFEELHKEFAFNLDPCATATNAKCTHFYSKEEDGLLQEWSGRVLMNPPYGREIGRWVEKAYRQAQQSCEVVVCLLPSRTDTKWFHDYVLGNAEIRFIKGRLKFGSATENAPFPCLLAIFRKKKSLEQIIDDLKQQLTA